MMLDSFKHKGLRNLLVEKLRLKGIKNEAVLDAISKVPRHLFMDSSFSDHAYQDKAFPISSGQTISQPYTVAFQTELLNVSSGDKVLEIGTGSGYQAAVLCEMGIRVYTIERIKSLFLKSKSFLASINYHPKRIIYGDGFQGYDEKAPYDAIIVTAGANEIPKDLVAQIKNGGVMVIPIGNSSQKMIQYFKKNTGEFEINEFGDFKFVPMLKDTI
tara:strand:+ start:2949 stop:3593 length:645 start_codon:yes stop_codon:yes gene_type:complete